MNRKRAFTLIELLVVIAIIALLVSILMPALSKAKELAKQTICLMNMKTIGLAFVQYENDSNGFMPNFLAGGVNGEHGTSDRTVTDGYIREASGQGPTSWTGATNWAVALWPYYKNLELFICPSDPYGKLVSTDRTVDMYPWMQPWGAGEAFAGAPRQSYFVNGGITPAWNPQPKWPDGGAQKNLLWGEWKHATVEQVTNVHMRGPSGLYRVGEHGTGWSYTAFWGNVYGAIGTSRWNLVGGVPVEDMNFHGNASIGEMHPRTPDFVQGIDGAGGANYLYMDGHAENRRAMPTFEESGAAPV